MLLCAFSADLLIPYFSSRVNFVGKGTPAAPLWSESLSAMRAVMKVKTFQIIVLQGIVGMLPWTAMVFFTMWFELIGKFI